MTRYRKKPVVVEAIRWTGLNEKECREFLGAWYYGSDGFGGLLVSTLEGLLRASVGDYLIRGIKGECYPCKEDIFLATYEKLNG